MASNIVKVAQAYLEAWQKRDAEGIAKQVHPEVQFVGPIAQTKGKEAYISGATRMFPLLKEIKVHTKFFDEDKALFTYDFVCVDPIGACRTAELITIKDGLVARVELFFDARPFEKMMQQRAQAS